MRFKSSAHLTRSLVLYSRALFNGTISASRRFASAAAESDVDALNKELADFFGVQHIAGTSSTRSYASSTPEMVGQSAMDFVSGHSTMPQQYAPSSNAHEAFSNQAMHAAAVTVAPDNDVQAVHGQHQGSSVLNQLQQCTVQLQQQVCVMSRLMQQFTQEQEQQHMLRPSQTTQQQLQQQQQQQQQQWQQQERHLFVAASQAASPSKPPLLPHPQLSCWFDDQHNHQQQPQHMPAFPPTPQPYTTVNKTTVPGAAMPPSAAVASISTLTPPANAVGDGVAQHLTHVDSSGKASMVDVSHKNSSSRVATASCIVHLGPTAYTLVKTNQLKKGDVLTLAQVAGIQGAKQTSNLIPLCHNIFLSKVDVGLQLQDHQSAVVITATAKTLGQTGVEMEALTAVSVAALTVYDMCKAVSKDIVISDIQLDHKEGGKSGTWTRVDDSIQQ